jgi:Rod binding domain-containing protein
VTVPPPRIDAPDRAAELAGQDRSAAIRGAAQDFEALLLTQLMATMRRTVPEGMFGNGTDSQIWRSMMDEALASQMAQAGGIGLADLLAAQLGGSETDEDAAGLTEALRAGRARHAYSTANDAVSGRPAVGALERVRQAAGDMLSDRGWVWGRAGRLTPVDLTNDYVTREDDGVAAFNVHDAAGFEDCYKCNLFAFELAYRAGLSVPLMGRGRGWGYFGPDGIVRQVEGGRLDGRWAIDADGLDEAALERAREQGRPFMLVGEGRDDRAGHVGIVDEVHRIERDADGGIRRIEYSGWEANGDGAHYRRRTWGVGRFQTIHLLELREPRPGEPQCFPMGRPASSSVLDTPRAAPDGEVGRPPEPDDGV